ncbi:phospholipase D-like domain-containing protein [Paenibacillus pabuli]|uniref:phospholipase D-like domain-containing protein n=1 Tax=Paenibacillus pabuli TaxID=1472 RepID=UPI002DBB6D86|nr:phospholipase D family protein [Paenibacillus pabuli]MEC0125197.1 phospholipase D family protein [Paenibacillus pabuli]
MEKSLTEGSTTDRVLLLEDGFQSGQVRIQTIREAKTNIDVAYYSIQKGKTSELFFAALFDAADRGVHIRIILDGIFHSLRGELRDIPDAIAAHPNVELRYYEPLHIFMPWTWHNRLHDKIFLVDNTYGIIGGQNIGDKYMALQPPKDYVFDRDVLVYNPSHDTNSTVVKMKEYIDQLWNHPFTKPEKHAKRQHHAKGLKEQAELARLYKEAQAQNDPFVEVLPKDWAQGALRSDHVAFIHNPIKRLYKDPIMWRAFVHFANQAKSRVYIQTPYAIPTKKMEKAVHLSMNPKAEWLMLTNSIHQTPNPLAFAGYLSSKKRLLDTSLSIYEYQGPYSIHGKSFVIDDYLSMVGSFNLDARSTFLNTESAVVISGSAFANQLTEAMDIKRANSTRVAKGEHPAESTNPKGFVFKRVAITTLSKLSFLWKFLL